MFKPVYDVKMDAAAYGNIDANRQGTTVKEMVDVTIGGSPRDQWFGHFLMAALGLAYPCVRFPVSSLSGTFSEGETVTESTSNATGVLRRNDQAAGTPVLYIAPATGTFTGGQTLTGGTSSATATGGTIESPSALRWHVFRRANTNTHPSFTIYNSDPLEDIRAAYCMLDTLEIECVAGEWVRFSARFMGKAFGSTSAQSPTYASQYPFFAKNAVCKVAATHNDLDAASALSVKRFKLTIKKNVTEFLAFGSSSPASLHNQQFDVRGDFTLLYNSTTQRDYFVNSTKRAIRLTLPSTGNTIGSGSVPTLQFDMPVNTFMTFDPSDSLDTLREQTLSFVSEYDITRSLTLECLLANARTTTY